MEGTTMKIFLSSTYVDLIEYRQAATEALERLNQQVGRMEIFGARPVEPSDACLSEIGDCDLFVGIYAHRYGYIPDGSMVSITEAEFRHARKLNKPIFCFVVEVNYPWPPEMIENEPGRTMLTALKAEISSSIVRDTFTTPDNLAYKIATSVSRYLAQPSSLLLPPPGMQIVSPGSHFGRLDSKNGRFALLLKMKFCNKSTQPILLQRFRIQYMGNWYEPLLRTGNIYLHVSTKIFAEALRREDDINESRRIPEMDERKRHAFFILPDPPDPLPGPERLHLTAEAKFVQRSPQQIIFTLTDRGEIEQEGGTGKWNGVKSLFLTLAFRFGRNPVNGSTTPNPI
jgi:hypothetical protein